MHLQKFHSQPFQLFIVQLFGTFVVDITLSNLKKYKNVAFTLSLTTTLPPRRPYYLRLACLP